MDFIINLSHSQGYLKVCTKNNTYAIASLSQQIYLTLVRQGHLSYALHFAMYIETNKTDYF